MNATAKFFILSSFALPLPLYVCMPSKTVIVDIQNKDILIFDLVELSNAAEHFSDLAVCSALFRLAFLSRLLSLSLPLSVSPLGVVF